MIRPAAALLAGLVLAGAAAGATTDAGPLLAAIDAAPVVALVRVGETRQSDPSGWSARLTIVRPLRGGAAGDQLAVVWEEVARGRPPRLSSGQEVLVALAPAPSGSLWRQREQAVPGALALAGDGEALLAAPSRRDVELLAILTALPAAASPADRAAALADLALGGSPPLALAALARLSAEAPLAAALAEARLVALATAAGDAQRPQSVRVALVSAAGAMRRPAARPPLLAHATPGNPLEAPALLALASIDGGLPADQAAALLDRDDPALRAIGARFASGNAVARRLPALVRGDPDPRVRAAAATALAATRTVWGVDGCLPALADRDPTVRAAAASALGALGANAVPTLERVARTQPAEARGALAALALAGPTGADALRRLSAELPDEELRAFARLALGQGPHAH